MGYKDSQVTEHSPLTKRTPLIIKCITADVQRVVTMKQDEIERSDRGTRKNKGQK